MPTLDRDQCKTQVYTYINCIHQKDFFIAIKVVEQLTLKMKSPVYTVHDNFITTSVFATGVSKIYTKVFMYMGHPLQIINEFIQNNMNPWYYDKVNDPIPSESLRTRLKSQEPKDLSFKDKLKWDTKIDETMSCYEEYVITVCGLALPLEGGICHAEKWNEFHSLLKSWEYLVFNYSMHF